MTDIPFFSEKTLILELGNAYFKCGFGNEGSPRHILDRRDLQQDPSVWDVSTVSTTEEWERELLPIVRTLYFRYLGANPQDRRVVVCEDVFAPTPFRVAMSRVLLRHLKVPSILFASTTAAAVLATGKHGGLVVDCGYTEVRVLPVVENRPLTTPLVAPLGGAAVEARLLALLLQTRNLTMESEEGQDLAQTLKPIARDIIARTCVVPSRTAQDTVPPDVHFPLRAGETLTVPGSVRVGVSDVIFQDDDEDMSLPRLVLTALMKSPVDARGTLCGNVIVSGGLAMLPGFTRRLQEELEVCASRPEYASIAHLNRRLHLHELAMPANCAGWVGCMIYGMVATDSNGALVTKPIN